MYQTTGGISGGYTAHNYRAQAWTSQGCDGTEATEKAKESLIDGKFPSAVSETVKQDAKEIRTIEDVAAAMWEGLE